MKTSPRSTLAALVINLLLVNSEPVLAQDGQTVPPGISKQERIPGKGKHKGWEKGKHRGWEKQKEKQQDASKKSKSEKSRSRPSGASNYSSRGGRKK